MTNDGIILENRRHIPRKQPPEVIRFVRMPARKGRKKSLHFIGNLLNNKDLILDLTNVSGTNKN